jgi:hypothetical protein
MLLGSFGMTLDMPVKILGNKVNGFAGDNLAGPDQSFLGLNLSVKPNSLGFFVEYS